MIKTSEVEQSHCRGSLNAGKPGPNVMIVAVEQVLMLVCHFAPALHLCDDTVAALVR